MDHQTRIKSNGPFHLSNPRWMTAYNRVHSLTSKKIAAILSIKQQTNH